MRTKGMFVVAAAIMLLGAKLAWAGTEAINWTYYGVGAGANNSNSDNTFIGVNAGYANTTGYWNTFVGHHAGYSNVTAPGNTFIGSLSGVTNNTGFQNAFLGYAAGYYNSTGTNNTFLGAIAGFYNNTGSSNTFLGSAGYHNTTGSNNTLLGHLAGFSNTTGCQNTFLGYAAGYNTTGAKNVFLGFQSGSHETGSNKLYIDNCYDGGNCDAPLIYGEFDNKILHLRSSLGVNTRPLYDFDVSANGESKSSMHFSLDGTNVGGWITSVGENNFFLSSGAVWDSDAGGWVQRSFDYKAVIAGSGAAGYRVLTRSSCPINAVCPAITRMLIDYSGNVGFGITPTYPLHMASGAYVSTGGVWVNASSRKYKDNIASLTSDEAARALEGLSPVSFTYKAAPEETHLGFIAEDVPAILATKDRKGMSPMDVAAVLTKVVQEQQQLVREKSKIIDQLQTTVQQKSTIIDGQQSILADQQRLVKDLAEQVKQLKAELGELKSMSRSHVVALAR